MNTGRPGIWQGIAVSAAALTMSIVSIELACRLLKIDFNRYNYNPVPIFYRMATVPVGEVFFRRPGPAEWRGKALQSAMRYYRFEGPAGAYSDEKPLVIKYDSLGFRNPEGFEDYEIAIAGDSCTELGYLAYEDLFSTRVGSLLGLRVKNLGVSSTSSLTQNYYLKEYGKSGNIKHAVMVFFEGNDIREGVEEAKDLDVFRSTGRRPCREIANNNSFVRAAGRLAKRLFLPSESRPSRENAYLESGGDKIPVSIFYAPPSAGQLTGEEKNFLDLAFSGLAGAAASLGAQPWVVYMPCKHRVFYGHIRFTDDADKKLVEWKPTDLPDAIRAYAAKYGVRFIDLTPVLIGEMERMRIPFNTVFDSHVNRHGSSVAAQVIADALRPYDGRRIGNGSKI